MKPPLSVSVLRRSFPIRFASSLKAARLASRISASRFSTSSMVRVGRKGSRARRSSSLYSGSFMSVSSGQDVFINSLLMVPDLMTMALVAFLQRRRQQRRRASDVIRCLFERSEVNPFAVVADLNGLAIAPDTFFSSLVFCGQVPASAVVLDRIPASVLNLA